MIEETEQQEIELTSPQEWQYRDSFKLEFSKVAASLVAYLDDLDRPEYAKKLIASLSPFTGVK